MTTISNALGTQSDRVRSSPLVFGGATCMASLAVLTSIYATFGVLADGWESVAGIGGAIAIWVSLTLRRRSRRVAAAVMVVGVVPFACAAAWTVFLPATAILVLSIGLPLVLRRSGTDDRIDEASP